MRRWVHRRRSGFMRGLEITKMQLTLLRFIIHKLYSTGSPHELTFNLKFNLLSAFEFHFALGSITRKTLPFQKWNHPFFQNLAMSWTKLLSRKFSTENRYTEVWIFELRLKTIIIGWSSAYTWNYWLAHTITTIST